MATMNQDNLVKNLQDRNTAKQDRLAASGYRAGMRVPPTVLSHPWRLVSPGSHAEPEPMPQSAIGASTLTATIAKQVCRPTASRSGSPATGRPSSPPFTVQTAVNGLAGHEPAGESVAAYRSGR